jgi:hypothetical protein
LEGGKNIFPVGKKILGERKIIFPGGKKIFPERKKIFPGGKKIFPERKKIFPGGKMILGERKMILGGGKNGLSFLQKHFPGLRNDFVSFQIGSILYLKRKLEFEKLFYAPWFLQIMIIFQVSYLNHNKSVFLISVLIQLNNPVTGIYQYKTYQFCYKKHIYISHPGKRSANTR